MVNRVINSEIRCGVAAIIVWCLQPLRRSWGCSLCHCGGLVTGQANVPMDISIVNGQSMLSDGVYAKPMLMLHANTIQYCLMTVVLT